MKSNAKKHPTLHPPRVHPHHLAGGVPSRNRLGAKYPDESSARGHGTYRMDLIIKADGWNSKNVRD